MVFCSAPRRLAVFVLSLTLFGLLFGHPLRSVRGQDVYTQRTGKEVMRDTVQARRFDDGRMWTFGHPLLDYFEERYGFRPDEAWLEKARLATLRIPGCTASFASPNGLILTNHHCGRSHATAVSRPGERILENGFYAQSLDEERRVEGLYADQLVEITDVSDEIRAAIEQAETDAERAEARRTTIEELTQRLTRQAGGEAAGYRVEIVPLYDGAQYAAYTYRRYEDVRLVMIPELDLGYYGGDTDNFTYPRYALDMSLFRVYGADGEPIEPQHFFEWNADGSRPGDPVFVVGNPGSTLRLETAAQLAFRRDVQDKNLLAFFESRVAALQAYVDETPEAPETWANRIFSLQNAIKLYRGRVEALNDTYIMTRIERGDQQFQEAIAQDSSLRAQYGGLIDSMAAVQEQKRAYADAYQAFRLIDNATYASATLRRALAARQYLERQSAGAAGEQLAPLRDELLGVASQPTGLDRRYLAARLRDFETYLAADSALVQEALDGRTPEAAAEQIIDASVLADSARTAQALEAGTLSMEDPALQLVADFYDRYQEYRSAWTGLMARQEEIASELGRARFAVYGHDVPPDATFTLRLADGVVQGYDYNGTVAPPYTTFYGMYGHYHAYGPDSEWALPDRWLQPPESFDRSTPINMVSTNDITGGNSGSPLLNQDLQLVGLIFDGNIESLAGDYIFLPGRMRAVSVDVRGMIEALDEIYDADRIVQEVTGGAFVEAEEAAPEMR